MNCSFNVKKVQCGKYYTAGINNDGIAFKFGVINYKNYIRKDNNIVFFNFKNNENFVSHFPNLNPEKVNDIFCGEELLCFITQKGEMFIYNEIQGLFKIKLNNESHENSLNYQQRQNNIIDNVKFIDRTFYAISKNNTCIYEFINYSYKNKDFDFNDYVQNEYDINENVKLSMLNQPYYVKVIFFRIKCSDYLFNEFEENEDKIFFKRKYHKESNNLSMTNHNFSNFNHTYDSFNNHNITSMNKITKISNMLNNIFDRKINSIINKTKVNYNSENAFLSGKKRIEIIKVDFENNSGINFLENEGISEIQSFNNTFSLSTNILNIPINENYIHEVDRKRKNSDDKERNKFKSKINKILTEDNENNNNKNNSRNNLFNKILNDDSLNSINKHQEEYNSKNYINGYNNTDNIINEKDNQIEKIKEKMNKLRKNVIDEFEQRKNDSNKKSEILINNLKNIDINDNKGENGEKKINNILEKFKNEIEKQKELNEKNEILRKENEKRAKEISKEINSNKNIIYDNNKNQFMNRNLKKNNELLNHKDNSNGISQRNSIIKVKNDENELNNMNLKEKINLNNNYNENLNNNIIQNTINNDIKQNNKDDLVNQMNKNNIENGSNINNNKINNNTSIKTQSLLKEENKKEDK